MKSSRDWILGKCYYSAQLNKYKSTKKPSIGNIIRWNEVTHCAMAVECDDSEWAFISNRLEFAIKHIYIRDNENATF